MTFLAHGGCETRGAHGNVDARTGVLPEVQVPEPGDNDEARRHLTATIVETVELYRGHVTTLEGLIACAQEAGWVEGIRVVRRYLHAALESLHRYEELLAAEAGLSDAELARAVEANRQALAKPWARAQHTFERARTREVRVERGPRTYRARARNLRPTYRRRAPRRATRLSAAAFAGDGSPPPEPDPSQGIDPCEPRRDGGAS